MKKLDNIHPGEILQKEFLSPLEISAYRLSKETFIPQNRISDMKVLREKLEKKTTINFKYVDKIQK